MKENTTEQRKAEFVSNTKRFIFNTTKLVHNDAGEEVLKLAYKESREFAKQLMETLTEKQMKIYIKLMTSYTEYMEVGKLLYFLEHQPD